MDGHKRTENIARYKIEKENINAFIPQFPLLILQTYSKETAEMSHHFYSLNSFIIMKQFIRVVIKYGLYNAIFKNAYYTDKLDWLDYVKSVQKRDQ